MKKLLCLITIAFCLSVFVPEAVAGHSTILNSAASPHVIKTNDGARKHHRKHHKKRRTHHRNKKAKKLNTSAVAK